MRLVRDAMRRSPVVVDASTTVQEASSRMLDAGLHAAVVVEKGKVCGVTTAELVFEALAQGQDASETPVGAIVDREAPVVRVDDTLVDAHLRLRAKQRAVAAVVGSHGEPLGLLDDDA